MEKRGILRRDVPNQADEEVAATSAVATAPRARSQPSSAVGQRVAGLPATLLETCVPTFEP